MSFLKAALFVCNCLLDPVVWLATCEFFPLSLAARRVKCQVVEDIFYSHSIWLPGWLLCQSGCSLRSYLCSCLVFKSMELLHPHMLFSFLTLNIFPEINTSSHSFHMGSRWEISLEWFFSSCLGRFWRNPPSSSTVTFMILLRVFPWLHDRWHLL